MTSPDWSSIVSSGASGAGDVLDYSTNVSLAKKKAKENKRRTLASLLSNALKRDQSLFRMGQEYEDEINDYKSQALQKVARGFVDAFKGSTRG